MILGGFFFLFFFGVWIFGFVFWVLKIVEVARIPEQQFRAAQSEKVTWVLIVVLAGLIGALVWQFAKRDAVLGIASAARPTRARPARSRRPRVGIPTPAVVRPCGGGTACGGPSPARRPRGPRSTLERARGPGTGDFSNHILVQIDDDGTASGVAGKVTADGVLAPGRRALTLGLFFTITLVGFEGLAVATIVKVINDDLHDIGLLGWIFSAFFLGNLFGVVAAGRAADRSGPARPFMFGLVLFAVGLGAGGLAPTMAALVVARAVQGIGAGAIPAVAYVAIGRSYPLELRPRMFAVLSTAWVLPGLIGPAISGAVAEAFGWRWVFLGLLPLVAFAALTTTRALHLIGPPGGAEPVDRRGDAVVLVIGAGLVLAGASAHSLIATPVLVVVGLIVAARAFLHLVPPGTHRLERGLPAAVALRGLATFAFFGTDAYVAFTVTSVRRESIALGGLALTVATLTWTVGAWMQERLVQRVGPQRFVRSGMLLIVAGIGIMIAVAQAALPAAGAVLAWGVAGLGMGLSYAPLSLVVLSGAPEGAEGAASASLQLCDTLGVALGTGVVGAIVAAGASLAWAPGTAPTVAFRAVRGRRGRDRARGGAASEADRAPQRIGVSRPLVFRVGSPGRMR